MGMLDRLTFALGFGRAPAPQLPAPEAAALVPSGSHVATELRAETKVRVRRASSGRSERFSYDAAKRSRLTWDWRAGNTGPNAEISAGMSTMRARAHDLVRNDPHAKRAIRAFANNVVSTGLTAKCTASNPKRAEAADALWNKWCKECTVDSDLGFAGLQWVAASTWFEGGDVLLRFRPRRLTDGLAVPLQLELLEGEFLDESRSVTTGTGGKIVQGVEFDPIGRRTAYWLYRNHPGEDTVSATAVSGSAASVAVSAADVCHLYRPERAGQVRGVTILHPVITRARDLAQYDMAERIRARSQAGIVGVVTPADDLQHDDESTDAVGTVVTDSDGNVVDEMEPGSFYVARNGKNITFTQPATNSGYQMFVEVQLRAIAAGCILPYEVLSGDLSKVNYSSIRLGMLEFQREITILQQLFFVPMFCDRVWARFIETAIAAGALQPGEYPVKWTMPHREEIDRETAINAVVSAVRAGIDSRSASIQSMGRDPAQVDAEIAADQKRADDLGLVFDSDGRHPRTGPIQPQQPVAPAAG